MQLQLKVSNMACSTCADRITEAITAVDPTAKVAADCKTKVVNVETEQPESAVRQAIATAGYSVVESGALLN